MKYSIAVLTVFATVLVAHAQTAIQITPKPGSRVTLEVAKTGILAGKKHVFTFSDYSGSIVENKSDSTAGHVEFSVRSASIQCTDTWVDEKDRKKILEYAREKMLAVDEYPELRFVSTGVQAQGADTLVVNGTLTIREKSHPTVVQVHRENEAGKSWWNGTATLRLSDFKLKRPSAALGTIGTADEMAFSFRLGQ